MATVRFTRNIQRHVSCPTEQVTASTLREALDAYFAAHERARGYVLDDRGTLRKHMAAFINGRQIEDRQQLSDALDDGAVIDIVQSLSGG
jgi:molybdopterin converting factor small subunit